MTDEPTPFIKSFELVGLHGYKNIRLDFKGPVKIVIAENGAGKTIFLSALDAFLTRNFGKLSKIKFERIECEIAGQPRPLVLYRNQLGNIEEPQSDLQEFAHYSGTDANSVRNAIMEYEGGDIRTIPILNRAYVSSPWSLDQTINRIRQLRTFLDQIQSDDLKQISSSLKIAVGATDILYLPTYRRVELSISKREHRRRLSRPRSSRLDIEEAFEEQHSNQGINYGLADVEERLGRITEFIQRRSNFGYREISAAIIDDLVAGRFASGDWQAESLPEIDSLRLFFSRIEQSPSNAEQRLEAITQLYSSGKIKEEANAPLRYFLARLSKVVDQTKKLESDIENFVQVSNEYLSRSSDKKLIIYDATKMKVRVINVWTESEIRLDDLSSGEKQVISLFAHLYLNQKNKIILIDEPELSLSIEWQRRLLPDVVNAPTCLQLLAITHSPFVFENELDPYASPLDVTRTKKVEVAS